MTGVGFFHRTGLWSDEDIMGPLLYIPSFVYVLSSLAAAYQYAEEAQEYYTHSQAVDK